MLWRACLGKHFALAMQLRLSASLATRKSFLVLFFKKV